MSKLVSQRHWKWDPAKHAEKIKDPVSIAMPNESYTVKELVERFMRGQPTAVSMNKPIYNPNPTFDSPDLEEVSRMDLVDRQEFAEELANKNRLIAEEFKRKRSAAKAEAESKKEVENRKEDARSRTTRQNETDAPDSDSDLDPAPPAQRRLQNRRGVPPPDSTTLT